MESVFDWRSIWQAAEAAGSSSNRGQGNGSRRPSAISPQAYKKPSLSSIRRRSSQFQRRKLSNGLFIPNGSEEGSREEELTNQQLYDLLDEYMKNSKPGDTIKLPSDVLHRKKSRIDTDELDDAQGIPGDMYIDLDRLAQDTALERDEESLLSRWKRLRKALEEFYQDTTILKGTLNRVQGRFGSAMMEYFVFIKWLIQINLFITLLSLPLIVPALYAHPSQPSIGTDNQTQIQTIETCSRNYTDWLDSYIGSRKWLESLADIIQGTGSLENSTGLFYGSYLPQYRMPYGYKYQMSYSFILITIGVLLISFVLILVGLSSSQQQAIATSRDSKIKSIFCYAVLSGWDYVLTDRKAVKLKKELIKSQLMLLKETVATEKRAQERPKTEKALLIFVRILINVLIIGAIVTCFVGIICLQDFTELALQQPNNSALELFYEYLTTAFVTVIYFILPPIFDMLVKFENYRPTVEINITLIRIFTLRLSSLFSLFISILGKLLNRDTTKICGNVGFTGQQNTTTFNMCWETFIGQEIYKLAILDMAVFLAVTYGVEYPRQWLYKKLHHKVFILEKLGQQEFDMPKNVMDAVYSQTLCWIGILFSPFIPLMVLIKLITLFWVKKASLFHNQKPSVTLSKSSEVYSFFLWIMLSSLLLAYVVIIICIGYIPPSMSCGPFRILDGGDNGNNRMLDVLGLMVNSAPEALQTVIDVVQSVPVVVSVIVLLIVMCYYWAMLSSALSHKIQIYTNQLAMNITDKQYYHKKVKEKKEAIEKSLAQKWAIRRPTTNRRNIDHNTDGTDDTDGNDTRGQQQQDRGRDVELESTSSSESCSTDDGNRHGFHQQCPNSALPQDPKQVKNGGIVRSVYGNTVGAVRTIEQPVYVQLDEIEMPKQKANTQDDGETARKSAYEKLNGRQQSRISVHEQTDQADHIYAQLNRARIPAQLTPKQTNGGQSVGNPQHEHLDGREMKRVRPGTERNEFYEPPCDYDDNSDDDSERYAPVNGGRQLPYKNNNTNVKGVRNRLSPLNQVYYNPAFEP